MLEDGRAVVAKFYRPARWSDAQLIEEHAFATELAADEIPVAAPLAIGLDAGSRHASRATSIAPTLAAWRTANASYRFGVAERLAGRAPELDDPDVRTRIGRYVGRLHAVGRRGRFAARQRLDVATFGHATRDWLLAAGILPPDVSGTWAALAGEAIAACERAFAGVGPAELRLHGDCHLGNVLWSAHGPHFVDLDDALTGPAVQDLWMLLAGDRATRTSQLADVLDGYDAFARFDRRELALVEPLRTLRMLHHSAWIARRWSDPAFPIAFPWFESPSYWAEQCALLREQLVAMDEPPLSA